MDKNAQQITNGLASVGVYARGKFSGNLKVYRPFELSCSPPERQAAGTLAASPNERAFRPEIVLEKSLTDCPVKSAFESWLKLEK